MHRTGIYQAGLKYFSHKLNLPLWISLCVFFTLLLACASFSFATPLRIEYIEYPPYYFTKHKQPSGFLLSMTEKIMKNAGVEARYISIPSKRVIQSIKKGGLVASIGWFKTSRRKQFAKFSIPIYKNKPTGILIRKKDESRFSQYNTLIEIMHNTNFKVGLISGHSEGEYIDSILASHPANILYISGRQTQLVKMLKAGRFDFCLLAPEEVNSIIRNCDNDPQNYIFKLLKDIPAGNKRYLMFSKDVPDEIIEKINSAIRELSTYPEKNGIKTQL